MCCSLQLLQGRQCALQKLDLRDNCITSLQELAVLADCLHLRELLLEGGSPGNTICGIPGYRIAVAGALPQLSSLDGQPLDAERGEQASGAAAQYAAAFQLQAYQPLPPPPPPPVPAAVHISAAPDAPVLAQLAGAPGGPDAESIADRLVARLARSGALVGLGKDLELGCKGREGAPPGWGDRVASLEARLAALQGERPQCTPPQTVQGGAANARQQQGQQNAAKTGTGRAGSMAVPTAAPAPPAGPAVDMQRLQVLSLWAICTPGHGSEDAPHCLCRSCRRMPKG